MTEKPTIVFIHGSGDSSAVWQEVTERLSEQPWVALDLPGHGRLRNSPGPETMSVEDYAAAVAEDLQQRHLSDVYLAGHSLGGAIALQLALQSHPPLVVRGLALIGTGARLRVAPELLETAHADPQTATTMLDELGVATGHEELARQYRRQAAVATPPGILFRDLAACNAFDLMAKLDRIGQPAIIVTGEQDRLTPPKYALFLQAHLPNATLALIPDAGHYISIEQPAALAQVLTSWLATGPLSRPATGR